jgi:hypothetical protein
MAFPTVTVTPGSGQTVNTLPNAGQATSANSLPVVIASDQTALSVSGTVNANVTNTVPVTGTFFQTTQPVSGTVNANVTNTVPVTGTFFQTTQPVSGTVSAYADGWDITQGTKADTAWTTGSGTVVSLLKAIDRDILAPIPGAVTTTAPTYTTGTTASFSLTTGGALRSDLSSYNGTALTGTVTAYGTAPTGNVFGVNAAVTSGTLTTVSTVTNVSQIASNVPAYAVAAGSTNKAAAVSQATAVSQIDQNATAFAGSGSVLGTVVASAQGGGAVISAEINVSALTLGTATAVFAILQESRGGTNFSDIWVSPPITATGIISTPPLVVAGRRRWRFFSIGGTSTTVTVTITTLELPAGGYPLIREGYDGFSATNPLATMFNNVTTASTLVSTTLSSTSNPIYIEGVKNLMASLTVTGGVPTTNPVLTLQTSIDGTNWFNTTLTLTPTAAGTFGASLTNITGRFARFIVSTASAGGTAYTFGKLGLLANN